MNDALRVLQAERQALKEEVDKIRQYVEQKAALVQAKEKRNQESLVGKGSIEAMEMKLKGNLPSYLAPGNVGDINKVIWPFHFVTENPGPIAPQTNVRTQYSVTQEAAFVVTHYTKAVFSFDPQTEAISYIDPNDYNAPGIAPNLGFTVRDAQSSRNFFNGSVDLDNYGNPRWPTKIPSPFLVIPNGVMEINFFNDDLVNYYIPRITFFGYRIRVENAEAMLSTIYG